MMKIPLFVTICLIIVSCNKTQIAATKTVAQEQNPIAASVLQDSIDLNPMSTYFLIDGLQAKHLGNLQEAYNLFQQAISVDENNDAAYFELSNIFQTEQFFNIETAIEQIDKAASIKPNNNLYQLTLSRLLVDNGQAERGINVLKKLVDKNPKNVDYKFDLAYAYEQVEQYKKALSIYDSIEEVYGYNPEVNYRRHVLYFESGDTEKGMEEIKTIVDNDPEYVSYAVFLAESYLKSNKLTEAKKYANIALQTDAANANAFAVKLQVITLQNDKDDLLATLNGVVDSSIDFDTKVQLLYPLLNLQDQKLEWRPDLQDVVKSFTEKYNDRAEAFALYGDLLYNGNQQAASEQAYLKSIEITDEVYSVWGQLMDFYIQNSDFDKLGPFAEKAALKFEYEPFAAYISGYAYFRNNKLPDAIRVLEKAANKEYESKQYDIEILSLLADSYFEEKQFEKAFLTYDRVLLKEPDNTHVLNNYSYYLAEQKVNLEKAEKMALRVMQLRPDDANTLDTYGWVLYQKGDYEKAEQILSEAAEKITDSAVIFEHYGDALFKNGKIDKAISQWQKALKLEPENTQLQQKINSHQ